MKTILILDDEPEICLLLAAILKGMGYSTIQSVTISEAKDRLHQNKVDLLIMDIHLADGNGIEEVPRMKVLKPGLQIVLMSAFHSQDVTRMELNQSIYAFMSKPFSRSQVVSIITHLFPTIVT